MKWRWIVLCDISTSFCFGHSLFMLVFLLKHPRYGQSSISVNQCHCVISLKLVSVWLHILWNWSQSGCVIPAKLFPIWMCDFCETVLNLIVSFLWNWSRTDCVIFFFLNWSQSGHVIAVKIVSVWLCDFCENGRSGCVISMKLVLIHFYEVWLRYFFETGLNLVVWFLLNCLNLIVWFLWNWPQSDCVISLKLMCMCVTFVKLNSVCLCDFCATGLLVWLLWSGLTLIVWFPWNW